MSDHDPYQRPHPHAPAVEPVPGQDIGYAPTMAMPPVAPPPASMPPWQIVLLTLLGVGAVAALLFLGVVLFGGGDDPAEVESTPVETPQTDAPVGAPVPALIETVWTCPEGSAGDPGPTQPDCQVTDQASMIRPDAVDRTVYSCPEGTFGSPSAEDPTCTRDESTVVAALAVTQLACPSGSTAAANGSCVVPAGDPVEAEPRTEYTCAEGATLDASADPPTCQRLQDREAEIDAVETVAYTCPEGTTGQPTSADDVCTSTDTERVSALCDGRQNVTTTCLVDGPPVSFEDDPAACPDGTIAVPASDDEGNDIGFACAKPGEWSCPEGYPILDAPDCLRPSTETKEPTAVAGLACPEGIDGVVEDDRCLFTTQQPVVEPAEGTTTYVCPAGYEAPAPIAPGSVCRQPERTVDPVEGTAYVCPDGATGSPTAANQTCTLEGTSRLPASRFTETTYRCPEGYGGTPSSAADLCARTTNETVPAVVEQRYVCPEGSTGTPTGTDPFCIAE